MLQNWVIYRLNVGKSTLHGAYQKSQKSQKRMDTRSDNISIQKSPKRRRTLRFASLRASSCICQRSARRSSSSASSQADFDDVALMAVPTLMMLHWSPGATKKQMGVWMADGYDGYGGNLYWLVVWTPLKNISQLGWLCSIYGKIKSVPNHQPV